MVDNKSKDESSTAEASSATHVFDTVRENFVRVVDQMANVQPQYSQAFSNLQLDYVQTAKNVVQNTISAQKQLVGSWNIMPVSTTIPYAEQFTRQTNEITNNALKAVNINNKLAINAVDVTRENLRIYNRTVDAVTEFSNNIAKVCTAFSTAAQQQQQQQFSKQ
jgi:phenylalanyl-tRNA synthetase alpha subunit